MSRLLLQVARPQILTAAQTAESPPPAEKTTYIERVVKFVPTEVIAAYLAMAPYLELFEDSRERKIAFAVTMFACLTAIPVYYNATKKKGYSVRTHSLVSMLAFVVWAYAIGGSFALMGWHHAGAAGLLLIIFSLFSGAIEPK